MNRSPKHFTARKNPGLIDSRLAVLNLDYEHLFVSRALGSFIHERLDYQPEGDLVALEQIARRSPGGRVRIIISFQVYKDHKVAVMRLYDPTKDSHDEL